MTVLRIVFCDQLSPSLSSLQHCDVGHDIILMCEVWDASLEVRHHKKKIAFLFSAMRHFAETLQGDGHRLLYTRFDDPDHTGTWQGEVARVVKEYAIERIILTHPSEHATLMMVKKWQTNFSVPVEVKRDDRFLISPEAFANWADGREHLRMEYFYREMRKQYGILMENGKPIGGKWNFDVENRKSPTKALSIPKPYCQSPDHITREVMALVKKCFGDHFGDLEPFYFAVRRDQALEALNLFISERLCGFGDYQDAMIEDEPWMYHGHIAFYLNCGLLLPLECVKAAEAAYHQGKAPLNSVEGFIRQIIGWREYVRGIYWLKMPEYKTENFFKATGKLPDFYWTADTKMNCLRQCVLSTKQYAYAHHIQRLMVLGNFALLAGIDPLYVNEWFWIVYADAYEWVELPNVSGMILFADGGYLASKPYAASGSYINKMSDYCKGCQYKVLKKEGEDACPFHYLYWDFLARNRDKLQSNHRMGMMYRVYDRMSQDKKETIKKDSKRFLSSLGIV